MVAKDIEHFEPIRFIYEGKITPYTRMTRRGKYVKPDAIRYLDSQNRLKNELAMFNAGKDPDTPWLVPEKTGFGVDMTFYIPRMHHCDLDNLVKAVMDAMQKIIFADDRYCDQIFANRFEPTEQNEEGVYIVVYEYNQE